MARGADAPPTCPIADTAATAPSLLRGETFLAMRIIPDGNMGPRQAPFALRKTMDMIVSGVNLNRSWKMVERAMYAVTHLSRPNLSVTGPRERRPSVMPIQKIVEESEAIAGSRCLTRFMNSIDQSVKEAMVDQSVSRVAIYARVGTDSHSIPTYRK